VCRDDLRTPGVGCCRGPSPGPIPRYLGQSKNGYELKWLPCEPTDLSDSSKVLSEIPCSNLATSSTIPHRSVLLPNMSSVDTATTASTRLRQIALITKDIEKAERLLVGFSSHHHYRHRLTSRAMDHRARNRSCLRGSPGRQMGTEEHTR